MKHGPRLAGGTVSGLLAVAGAVVVLSMGVGVATALAQTSDLRPLLDRLERLERDIRTLNIQLSRSGKAPPAGTAAPAPVGVDAPGEHVIARFGERLAALEEELRQSTGSMENLTHTLDQISLRLDKLVFDVDDRLRALESASAAPGRAGVAADQAAPPRIAAAPSPPAVERAAPGSARPSVLGTISESDLRGVKAPRDTSAPPPGVTAARAGEQTLQPAEPAADPSVLPEGTPQVRYNYARGLLGQARYNDAETALQAFLQAHGDDPLASAAHYWLGETYYVQGDFVRSAKVFAKGYESAPKGAKAADSLLKLGMSLAKLDEIKLACKTFGELTQKFPDAQDYIVQHMTRERKRHGCS